MLLQLQYQVYRKHLVTYGQNYNDYAVFDIFFKSYENTRSRFRVFRSFVFSSCMVAALPELQSSHCHNHGYDLTHIPTILRRFNHQPVLFYTLVTQLMHITIYLLQYMLLMALRDSFSFSKTSTRNQYLLGISCQYPF